MVTMISEACIANKYIVSKYEVCKQSAHQLIISSVQTYRTAVVWLMLGDQITQLSTGLRNKVYYVGGFRYTNCDPASIFFVNWFTDQG